jgi:DNA primase
MTLAQIERFLSAIYTEATETGATWAKFSCPRAPVKHSSGKDSDPSMALRIQPGDSWCHCFSCGFSGWAMDLLIDLQALELPVKFSEALEVISEAEEGKGLDLPPGDYEDMFEQDKIAPHVFPELILEAFEAAYCSGFDSNDEPYSIVHPYLEVRDTDYEVAEFLNLRYDPHESRIVFPVRDFEGRLRGVHGRSISDKIQPKYKMYPYEGKTNPHVWLGESWVDFTEPVVVAESVFDLTRVLEVWPNVISPLRAGMSAQQLIRISHASVVLTLFDGDEAGDMARRKIKSGVPDAVVKHLPMPEGLDADQIPSYEIEQWIHDALVS